MKIIALAATIIVFFALFYLGNAILGVVILALVLWSLFPNRFIISSVIIILILVLLQTSVGVDHLVSSVLSTYGTSGLWIIVSGFILATAMDISGLAKRLALSVVSSLGANPRYVILSVALVNLLIAPLSPSTTAKAFLMLPICIGLIQAFNAKKGSAYAAAIMLMSLAANNIASTAFLTATVPNPISASYMAAAGLKLSWTDWFIMAFPLTVVLLIAAWVIIEFMFKPDVKESKKALQDIVKMKMKLGPMKREEKIVAILFLAALVLWITEKYIPYAGLISLILSLLLLLPRIGVLKIKKFTGILPWDSLFVFAAAMYLAKAVEQSKAMTPVVKWVFERTGISFPSSVLIFLAISLGVLMHVFFTSTTVYATVIMPVVIAVAGIYGMSAATLAVPFAFAVPLALILPVNTIPNIIFYSAGYFSIKQIVKYGIILSIISIVVIMFLGMPYWKFIGIIKP
jgi:anion transporter